MRDPLVIVRKVSQLPVPSMYGLIGSTVDAIHQIFWHRWSAERWTWLETKSSEVSESSIFLRLTACLQRMSWVTPEFVARHCTESCKIAMRLSSLMHRRKENRLGCNTDDSSVARWLKCNSSGGFHLRHLVDWPSRWSLLISLIIVWSRVWEKR